MTTEGRSYVNVHAGHLEATTVPATHIGKQTIMRGSGITFYFTADVARQWIGVLETIAKEGE